MKLKKEQKTLLAIASVIVVVYLFSNPTNNEMMTFYDHKECLVYGDYMIGCEASGTTYTTYMQNYDNYGGHGSCTAFLNAYGCKPENCNYIEGGECDGITEEDTLSRECTSDEECIQRFGNTAYRCAINPLKDKRECVFQGNHMPSDEIEIYGLDKEEENSSWIEKRSPELAAAGTVLFMFFISILS